MRTLAITNQKGGVGKTTIAFHLSIAIARRNLRVLAVDLDPQASLTLSSGVDFRTLERSVYDVIVNDLPPAEVIQHARSGYDILPSDLALDKAQTELPGMYGRERRLKRALDKVRDSYDWCLVDCPPTLGVLTQNALFAADAVVVPCELEVYAVKGLQTLLDIMNRVREDNPGLHVATVVPSRVQRNGVHKQMYALLDQLYGELPKAAPIPDTVHLKRAVTYGDNVFDRTPTSPAARALEALADDILGGGALAHAS